MNTKEIKKYCYDNGIDYVAECDVLWIFSESWLSKDEIPANTYGVLDDLIAVFDIEERPELTDDYAIGGIVWNYVLELDRLIYDERELKYERLDYPQGRRRNCFC